MNTCKQAPGAFIPKINRECCEGKGPCVPVCPYQVLAVQTLPPEQCAELSLKGKLKGLVHR